MKKVYATVEQIRVNSDEWEMTDEEFERLQQMNHSDRLKEISRQLDPCNFYVDSEELIEFDEVIR